VGNRVNVFSRQLHLVDYGDQYTANQLGSRKERYDDYNYYYPEPQLLQRVVMAMTSQLMLAVASCDP